MRNNRIPNHGQANLTTESKEISECNEKSSERKTDELIINVLRSNVNDTPVKNYEDYTNKTYSIYK